MSLKKKIRFIHKWLGLTSGLIVFIISVTGCIFCFQDEIKDITRKEWRLVESKNQLYISPTVLEQKSKKIIPNSTPSLIAYHGKNRTAVVYSYTKTDQYFLYFNPYTGRYLKKENLAEDFFIIVEHIHMYLLLPDYVGKHIISGATIIFIILLISGIIQWWPKRKSDLKRSFSIKWSAKWKRVNYDWHNTTGLYISLLTLIIAITGLCFSYEWVADGIYKSFNFGGDRLSEIQAPKIDTLQFDKNNKQAINKAFLETMQKHPKAEMYFVTVPQSKSEPINTGAYPHSLRYDQQSNYYFHPETGKLIQSNPFDSKSLGLQVVEMNYGIHTGQVLNLPGKIMAFIASLLAAALPVTGFVIWYGRGKKKRA